MTNASRLPGIVFEAEPLPPPEILPRMDISALVGFAASGPLHTPVAVEDLARFRELFGPNLPLAWDNERGTLETAWLGPAVESFFRNGGRRLWVVRVAGSAARVHRFWLNGLVQADSETAAYAQARSAGSWADALKVDTVLERRQLPLANSTEAFVAAVGDYRLVLRSTPEDLVVGDLLELVFSAADELRLYWFVEHIASQERGSSLFARQAYWYRRFSGSPAEPAWLPVTEAEGIADSLSSPIAAPSVRLLRFEIRVERGDQSLARLGNLGFAEEHPRFWARLPGDEALFARPQGRLALPPPSALAAFLAEAANPRFPLAGPDAEERSRRYLPIGMASRPDPERARGPEDLSGEALRRDGLEQFHSALFLDPDLKRIGTGALLREAEHKYYIRQQPLRGLHSLLPLDEVTLIAVPDAVHQSWNRQAPPPTDFLAAPELAPIPAEADAFERYRLRWSEIEQASAYLLEQDDSTDFDRPTRYFIELTEQAANAQPPSEYSVILQDRCPEARFFRVRALRHGQTSPWSLTRGRILPQEDFNECDAVPIIELHLEAIALGSPTTEILLRWWSASNQPIANLSFELQQADDAEFSTPRLRWQGSATEIRFAPPSDATVYYRVRTVAGPWSDTVLVEPATRSRFSLNSEFDDTELLFTELLAIQRALIRFCAARGDLLACLSLPRHFRRREALDHLEALIPASDSSRSAVAGTERPQVTPLTRGEAPALSYAALYHPWPAVTPESASSRSGRNIAVAYQPPEGIVLGDMARLALEQGAWLAPANRVFNGVLALDPRFGADEWRSLSSAQVNLLIQDPRGFLALNAETLSSDPTRKPIHVRRLLILLRRLALREGKTYVFEPNDTGFRSLARHRFERFLSDLYVRGGLAGAVPNAAYQVVADESVNTPQSVAMGRFIVELRVAPARPLAFLTVRLVQSGPQQLLVQEA